MVSDAVLFRLAASIGLANLAWFGVVAVVVPFATRDLQLAPAELGLAMGAMGPAGLLGAVLAAPAARWFGLGPTLVASLVGELLSRVVLVLAGGPPLIAALGLGLSQALFGFIAPLFDVNANTLRQTVTPQRLLGRVSAASTFIGVGTAPLGALLAGWIGEVAGPRTALAVAAVITLASVASLISSSVPRLRAAPEALG
jgi:predicted MFS family arabinose efflux permease